MKNLKKLGKVLSTKEQKNVNGGSRQGPGGVIICTVCNVYHIKVCGNGITKWIEEC